MTEGEERAHLAFEREKWRDEVRLREREINNHEKRDTLAEQELKLKEKDLAKSAWRNPLFLALLAATVAAIGNAGVAYLNGQLQRELEERRAAAQFELERTRAEAGRILEVIKTGDPQAARRNLSFLLEAGLVSDEGTAKRLRAFLQSTPSENLPSLPAAQGSGVKPGTQLHVLAVGVGDYNEEKAKHLRLEFADDDAWDVASALVNTQGSLYAKVNLQALRNDEATRAGIFRALDTIQKTMQQDDVAVVYFSGHGALAADTLYLLPYEVDARDLPGIAGSAIEIAWLRMKLMQLAERGRVLVLLDACRSGAATEDGGDITVDASQLRAALVAANVTVLTSSSGKENSIENEKWRNGAFTEVFLEALGREADIDRNGVVSVLELTRYITAGVPRLVHEVDPEHQQTPGIEVRFEQTIFAAGL